MRKQLARGLAAAAVLAITAGCSSGGSVKPPSPTPNPSQSFARELNREIQLRPVLVGCLAKNGLIPAKDLDDSWYKAGHVTYNQAFIEWWRDFEGLPVKLNGTYQHLDDVVRFAATRGTWPAKLCGPIPSPTPAGA
jgi:hypothetical protein